MKSKKNLERSSRTKGQKVLVEANRESIRPRTPITLGTEDGKLDFLKGERYLKTTEINLGMGIK